MYMKENRPRGIKCEEDRISSLPDCLLINIISRLPSTRQALKTGILSKRWKNLWTEVHNLYFLHRAEEGIPYICPEFFPYIEKVIRQRGQLNLNKFQLVIANYKFGIDKQVNNWIRYAVSCNVQDLDLALDSPYDEHYRPAFVLDQFFFINSSFTHMKLDGCVINPTGAISWTNLKSLCIKLGVLDERLIKKILSGCPLLETLKLQDCDGFCRIDITSNSVKNLVFAGYRDDEWNAIQVVEINAPHILSLTIKEELSSSIHKVVLLNVSSLVEATLDYCKHERWWRCEEPASEEDEEEMLKDLILSLHHVKKLKIGDNCLNTLDRLEAKGFAFPSNIDWPDDDSTESEDKGFAFPSNIDWLDDDSTESENL